MLTGIHVYLGLHVLARGVIFVDLALAQVAALGITRRVPGRPSHPEHAAYWYALAFAVGGAALFAVTRVHRRAASRRRRSSASSTRSPRRRRCWWWTARPQGGEHIKQLLVGSILTVTPAARWRALAAALRGDRRAATGWCAGLSLEISLRPGGRAGPRPPPAPRGTLVFYVSFALVVTSSVRMAGVLLVFSYLIVPAAVAALLTALGAGAGC